jgi:hypothetical protein
MELLALHVRCGSHWSLSRLLCARSLGRNLSGGEELSDVDLASGGSFDAWLSSWSIGSDDAVHPPPSNLHLVAHVIEIFGLSRDDLQIAVPSADGPLSIAPIANDSMVFASFRYYPF